MAEVPAAVEARDSARVEPRTFGSPRDWARDTIGGLVASIVLVANIVSFGALMFPGELSSGISVAIWAMLIGSSIGGIWIAWTTSLPPIATGIDSPTGAFLVLLSASAGSAVTAGGGTPQAAVTTVMLIFTAATVTSGALFYVIGVMRWGSYFRFVPYFVVGGFLAATGWFLVAGGVRMTTGVTFTLEGMHGVASTMAVEKLASAIGVLVVLLAVRRYVKWALAMPVALVITWILGAASLHALGLSGREQGWYLPSLGALTRWLPLQAVRATHLTWSMVLGLTPEFLAVSLVALVSLVTKVASLEVVRDTSGDLDREFRAHGVANLVVTPLGGIACSLQTGTSRLLEQAGGGTRFSGVIAALVVGAVGVTHLDLPGLIPIPIVAGLVFYLGYTFIVDALARPFRQRARMDLLLAVLIMLVCIRYGYLVGVLIGLIGACVLFALNYARLGVVRRHATRRVFTSFVDRSAEASDHLRLTGEAIQIYWLSGYIFFGSSEGLFERIRHDIEALPPHRVRYVVLDFGMVSGADSSALASLTKLTNYSNRSGTTLVYAALSVTQQAMFERSGLIGGNAPHKAFVDLNHALAWSEDCVIADSTLSGAMDVESFEQWLQERLGEHVDIAAVMPFLERKDLPGSTVLYREGDPADTVDFVAGGNLAIDIAKADGARLRVRRFMMHTVVGEMGFVRRSVRSATVWASGPATVFSLRRESLERMRRERADLAAAFDDFLLRALADRIDAANRTTMALGG